MAAGAAAQPFEYRNDSGGTALFYGQFSPAILSFDDGSKTRTVGADNANSNSRVGVVLTQPFGTNRLKLTFETALGFRQTSAVSQNSIPRWIDWQRTDLRKFEAAFITESHGTFTFGQGSMATDGVPTLSGTNNLAGSVTLSDTAGSFLFRETTGELSSVAIKNAFDSFNGSRRFRVRYDTPEFAGFTFAAAYGQNILADDDTADYYDAALNYFSEQGDFRFAAAIGYSWKAPQRGSTTERVMGSGYLLHTPTGLSLTVAAGNQVGGGSYGYVAGGWERNQWGFGTTALNVVYYSGSDFETRGSSSEAWGLTAIQTVDAINLDIYVAWRNYAYDDRSSTSYQDGQSLLAGVRYRF